ncbi:hypothetical protein ACQP1G_14465 [Nocardia sp. CA-107356]|uniref:hypothetical protein n=1 Tax=Nocardia sp. CA-107356 TaxID=3239972 RepID=UPI003D9162B2
MSDATARGLRHFDTHFRNILTDGRRLFLTDFGLAASSRFELSTAEAQFLRRHASHNGCYVISRLTNWVVETRCDPGRRVSSNPQRRNDFLRRCAEGCGVLELPPRAAAIVRRYAPAAVVFNDFYFELHTADRRPTRTAKLIEHTPLSALIRLPHTPRGQAVTPDSRAVVRAFGNDH